MRPVLFVFALLVLPLFAPAQDIYAPVVLGERTGGAILLPDGTMKQFISEGLGDNLYKNYSQTSTDGGLTWGAPVFEFEGKRANLPLLAQDGEYHLFPMEVRHEGEGRREIAVNYFIDVWHVRTSKGGTQWEPAQRIFAGYVGSLNCVLQLKSGRILLPFAEWIGGRPQGPPYGANVTTCVYTDDGGKTWHKSPAQLKAPRYTDYNGSGYGACEPVLIELKDGRVYMLARTEAGRLYESWSHDGGVNWEPLRPSRFILFWNGCEKPPRVGKDGVYGGRDIVHAAISSDECQTWRGFREVYRDPTRNETPPRTGDRGTAYPMPYLAANNKVIVMTGQGRAGATFIFDPNWLLETEAKSDFSNGLEDWSVFKPFGPAEGWWRDRVQGPALVDHPDEPGAEALWIRRPDDKDGDGAVWNFPLGLEGEVSLRLMIKEGSGGARIALMDRFFDPADPAGDIEAPFTLTIEPDGHISIADKLTPGQWHTLRFAWSLPERTCVVSVDGTETVWIGQAYRESMGVNYVRVRSLAAGVDTQGLLLESVEARVEP
jgi:hypothetical protein